MVDIKLFLLRKKIEIYREPRDIMIDIKLFSLRKNNIHIKN